jgi:tetratricopeptide (TPR) repeat protein
LNCGVFVDVGSIYYYLGQIAYNFKDFQKALECYEHSREILEKYSEESDRSLIRLYIVLGDTHFQLGREKEALNSYEKAMILMKGNPVSNEAKEDQTKLAEKIASLKQSIESNTK